MSTLSAAVPWMKERSTTLILRFAALGEERRRAVMLFSTKLRRLVFLHAIHNAVLELKQCKLKCYFCADFFEKNHD